MIIVLNDFLLVFLMVGAILSGILVITVKNPVISVFFLISVFVNVAIYLVLLGLPYLGLVYLIVYVGAIAILFLFVIMMLNLRLIELIETGRDYTKNIPLGFFLAIIFILELINILPFSYSAVGSFKPFYEIFQIINGLIIGTLFKLNTSAIYIKFQPDIYNSDITLNILTDISVIGHQFFTIKSGLLILVCFTLLLGMVGPIVLCLDNKEKNIS